MKVLQDSLMLWGRENRRDFIWRRKRDEFYIVFISEFLLRRTRSEVVDEFLRGFIERMGSFREVASSSEQELVKEFSNLGMQNQRARAIKQISEKAIGREPFQPEEIVQLPHCGRYMANAVGCFYHGLRMPIVDSNIQRLFHRYFSIPISSEIHKDEALWSLAESVLPEEEYVNFNYHLLDFCAVVCKPRNPSCDECPIGHLCDYHQMAVDVTESV